MESDTAARIVVDSDVCLRRAELQDAKGILAIYAPYVEDSAITFETQVPSVEEFLNRMNTVIPQYPYLVAEKDGVIVGYAYAHRYKERQAYQWSVELSVYVELNSRGRKLGRALVTEVMHILELQGIRNVFSVIALPNDASVHLHEALGFQQIGIQRKVGYKLGEWHDAVFYQKQIGNFCDKPEPVLTAAEALANEKLRHIPATS